jgi:hypothetical protein
MIWILTLLTYQLPEAPPPPDDPPLQEKPHDEPLLPELHDTPEPPDVNVKPPIEAFPLVRKSFFSCLYQGEFLK